MKLRCRPNDLCEIVGGDFPELIHKRVIVLRLAAADEPTWDYVNMEGSKFVVHSQGFPRHIAGCEDRCLRPIRPEPEQETQETVDELSLELL